MHVRIAAAVAALTLAGCAFAQSYPSRAIRVIIPQTPGSGVDLIVRKAGEELLPRLDWVELDGEPAMSKATFVNGPKRLPIRFGMR